MSILKRLSYSWTSRNARLILLARASRAFAYGFLSVVLGIYLEALGLDPFSIGLILTGSLVGAAAFTLLLSTLADRYGRRRLLKINALLMLGAGLVFALSQDFLLLLLAALTGTISVATSERGAFLSLEQAILPQTAPEERRTQLFSIYNLASSFAGALGALISGAPLAFQVWLGIPSLDAVRLMFFLYGALALLVFGLFTALTEHAELAPGSNLTGRWGVHRSAGTVAKLSVLFSLDSLGGGLVIQSFLAYWFHSVHGIPLDLLGRLFFLAGLLEAGSFLVAAGISQRIGLVNTMVFTHLPSNLLLMLIPLAPSPWLAAGVFLARQSLSQMDVPTRQSYVMAVVDPEERAAAAGITNVARVITQSISPAFAGYALQLGFAGLPFFLGGTIKAGYDLALYLSFKDLRPPEEASPARAPETP